VRDKLNRIPMRNGRGYFGEVTAGISAGNFNLRITRNIDRVVLRKRKALAVRRNLRLALQTNQTGLVIVVLKTQGSIIRFDRDTSVVQEARRGCLGRDG